MKKEKRIRSGINDWELKLDKRVGIENNEQEVRVNEFQNYQNIRLKLEISNFPYAIVKFTANWAFFNISKYSKIFFFKIKEHFNSLRGGKQLLLVAPRTRNLKLFFPGQIANKENRMQKKSINFNCN